MKKWWILGTLAIGAIVTYAVMDKPIVRTIEIEDDKGIKRRRLTINIIVGIGNTINYNYKDES